MCKRRQVRIGSMLMVLALLCWLTGGTALGDFNCTRVTASDGTPGDGFGRAVSMDGEYAIIGAPDAKCAYVFKLVDGRWTEQARLSVHDAPNGFGASVAISGSLAVVGSVGPEDGDDTGEAWVFCRTDSGWEPYDKLHPCFEVLEGGHIMLCPYSGERFGASISVWDSPEEKDDTIVVGAPGDENGKGCVYVFRLEPYWVHMGSIYFWTSKRLTASDGAAGDGFGGAVWIDGDVLAVGAPGDDDNGADSGSAYVFRRGDTSGWQQEDKLSGVAGSEFGTSVCLNKEILAVGATKVRSGIPGTGPYGEVYAYTAKTLCTIPTGCFTNWTRECTLTSWGTTSQSHFGLSVGLDGSLLIVGAPLVPAIPGDPNPGTGLAYMFRREKASGPPIALQDANYEPLAILHPEGGTYTRDAGYSVAVSGNYALVGTDPGTSAPGEAFFYARVCPAADLNGDCTVDLQDLSIMADQWLRRN